MQDPSLYSQIRAQVQNQFPEQEHLKCPRCHSTNTKFCYYNNYNLSQPRHFCKSCRRYWTKGGALRNIPVGGGSRKNTKRSSSAPAGSAAAKRPAAAESVPAADNKIPGQINNKYEREMSGTLLPLKGENFGGQFGNLMEVSGSFGLLLGSIGGQFGSFTDGLGSNGSSSHHFGDPGSGQNVDPRVLGSGSSNNAGGFLTIQGGGGGGGDGGCWTGDSNGCLDLAMYTPRPTFQ